MNFTKYLIMISLFVILQAIAMPCYAFSSSVISVSAGGSHSLALTDDGNVLVWGNNDHGQLGDGTNKSRSTPMQVNGLDHIIAIAAGTDHSLALRDDGTVWAWGDNYHGTLGDGTTEDRLTPVQVSSLTNVKSIAAGNMVSLALKDDGTLWAWGFNKRGGLGDGTVDDRLTPVQVIGIVDVIEIGDKGTFAITDNGRVWAWGDNTIVAFSDNIYNIYGILGDNDSQIRPIPFQVEQASDVKSITNGVLHTVFLKEDGTVWTWGINSNGQLGADIQIDDQVVTITPVNVSGLNNIKDISAGGYYTLALKNDGTVWKWGQDYYVIPSMSGVFSKSISIPTQINGLDGVKDISSGDKFFIALKDDGSLWGWGYNENGQVGTGKNFISSPVKIIEGSNTNSHTSVPNITKLPNATLGISSTNNMSTNYPTSIAQNSWLNFRLFDLISPIAIIICIVILVVGLIIYFGVIRKVR
jgi:alpha-tubulin suppressor-like RCC1 family protein